MTPRQLDVLLTVDEVADLLRVSPRTVQRLVAAGEIRVIRVGRKPLISESEFLAYLAARRKAA